MEMWGLKSPTFPFIQENKMKKILYVYGLGSSPQSTTASTLGELLRSSDMEIVTTEYNQAEPKLGLSQLERFIESEKLDGIVASSLGAFFALVLNPLIPRILINICFRPSVELPKLGYDGSKYKPIEDYLQREYHNQPPVYLFEDVVCLFGSNDELFSYKDEMSMLFPTYTFNCGHHPDKQALIEMLPYIVNKVNHPLNKKSHTSSFANLP